MQGTYALIGPLVRQVIQWAAGAAVGVGVITDADITTAAGIVMSAINLIFVIKARIRDGKQ